MSVAETFKMAKRDYGTAMSASPKSAMPVATMFGVLLKSDLPQQRALLDYMEQEFLKGGYPVSMLRKARNVVLKSWAKEASDAV